MQYAHGGHEARKRGQTAIQWSCTRHEAEKRSSSGENPLRPRRLQHDRSTAKPKLLHLRYKICCFPGLQARYDPVECHRTGPPRLPGALRLDPWATPQGKLRPSVLSTHSRRVAGLGSTQAAPGPVRTATSSPRSHASGSDASKHHLWFRLCDAAAGWAMALRARVWRR